MAFWLVVMEGQPEEEEHRVAQWVEDLEAWRVVICCKWTMLC